MLLGTTLPPSLEHVGGVGLRLAMAWALQRVRGPPNAKERRLPTWQRMVLVLSEHWYQHPRHQYLRY
jgi:hypothetical protein